ncbi:MAG: hypothetical protein IIY87_01885 [Bacteroidales bacterium]|nr:hypothetical protein [Bacteroidales bacterium]
MKEQIMQYLLKKLRDMEEARQKAGREPNVILTSAFRYSVMEDLSEAMEELVAQGLVESGRTLNEHYFKLNPENATE